MMKTENPQQQQKKCSSHLHKLQQLNCDFFPPGVLKSLQKVEERQSGSGSVIESFVISLLLVVPRDGYLELIQTSHLLQCTRSI